MLLRMATTYVWRLSDVRKSRMLDRRLRDLQMLRNGGRIYLGNFGKENCIL
jgi:hypothetical protein